MIGVVNSVSDCDTKRPPTMAMPSGRRRIRSRTLAESQRQAGDQRAHRGHHDWPESQQTGLMDCLKRAFAFVALGYQREVDHHDGVFLDDADQENDADEGDQRQVVAE